MNGVIITEKKAAEIIAYSSKKKKLSPDSLERRKEAQRILGRLTAKS